MPKISIGIYFWVIFEHFRCVVDDQCGTKKKIYEKNLNFTKALNIFSVKFNVSSICSMSWAVLFLRRRTVYWAPLPNLSSNWCRFALAAVEYWISIDNRLFFVLSVYPINRRHWLATALKVSIFLLFFADFVLGEMRDERDRITKTDTWNNNVCMRWQQSI